MSAFLTLCRSVQSDPGASFQHRALFGDRNSLCFALPRFTYATDLRRFLQRDFEAFDTIVTDDAIARVKVFELLTEAECEEELRRQIRPWLHHEPTAFDTSITGESAWVAMECDVIKHDITTPKQEQLIALRSQRSRTVEWKRKRFCELLQRFTTKYTHSEAWFARQNQSWFEVMTSQHSDKTFTMTL